MPTGTNGLVTVRPVDASSDLKRKPRLPIETHPEGVDLVLVHLALQNEGTVDREALTPRDAEVPRECVDGIPVSFRTLDDDGHRLLLLHRREKLKHLESVALRVSERPSFVASRNGFTSNRETPTTSTGT